MAHTSTDKPALARLKTLIEEDLGFGLFKSIEAAKVDLSEMPESTITFQSSHLDLDFPLLVSEFESYIAPLVHDINQELTATLSRAHLQDTDIDSVMMTGGSSRVGMIHRVIQTRFGVDRLIPDTDQFTSVATGLALSQQYLSFASFPE